MGINIRVVKRSEIEELSEMWYDLATMHEEIMEGYDLSDEPKKSWIRFIEKGMDKEGMVTYVAEDDGELVGFLNVVIRRRPPFFKERDVGMILDVFVKPERRGEGIGSTLVDAAENWIDDKGVNVAVLTVAPVNENALEFWTNRGYNTYLEKKRKEL